MGTNKNIIYTSVITIEKLIRSLIF